MCVACKPNAMISMQGCAGSALGLPCGCMNRCDCSPAANACDVLALSVLHRSAADSDGCFDTLAWPALAWLLRVTCKPNAMVSMKGCAGSTLGLLCGCTSRSGTLMSVSGSNTHALAAFEKSVVQLCSCPRLLLSRVPSSQKRPWHCPADLAADSYRHSRR